MGGFNPTRQNPQNPDPYPSFGKQFLRSLAMVIPQVAAGGLSQLVGNLITSPEQEKNQKLKQDELDMNQRRANQQAEYQQQSLEERQAENEARRKETADRLAQDTQQHQAMLDLNKQTAQQGQLAKMAAPFAMTDRPQEQQKILGEGVNYLSPQSRAKLPAATASADAAMSILSHMPVGGNLTAMPWMSAEKIMGEPSMKRLGVQAGEARTGAKFVRGMPTDPSWHYGVAEMVQKGKERLQERGNQFKANAIETDAANRAAIESYKHNLGEGPQLGYESKVEEPPFKRPPTPGEQAAGQKTKEKPSAALPVSVNKVKAAIKEGHSPDEIKKTWGITQDMIDNAMRLLEAK